MMFLFNDDDQGHDHEYEDYGRDLLTKHIFPLEDFS